MVKKKSVPWLSESDEDADWIKKKSRKDELKAAMDKLREWVRINGRTG